MTIVKLVETQENTKTMKEKDGIVEISLQRRGGDSGGGQTACCRGVA